MATPAIQDPWLDEGVSLGNNFPSYFEELPQINEELNPPDNPGEPKTPDDPQSVEEVPSGNEPVGPAPTEPTAPAEPPQPRVTTFEDGSSLTVEQTNKGWKAVLDTNVPGVNPETFYGKTKDELYSRIAAGKVHATRKIRELNKAVKLGTTDPVPVRRQVSSRAAIRDLTPEEIFEYRTLYESNPQAAMDYYNEKRYGLSPADFARKLNEGTMARQLGDIESVSRSFVSSNPDYYATQSNFYTLIKYLVRKHFGRGLSADEDLDQLTIDLLENGVWTVDNLEQAKDDLLTSELLELAPTPKPVQTQQPELKPQPAPVAAPPAATPPAQPTVTEPARITPQPTVRTRAGNLGIKPSETINQPVVESPSSAENVDFNTLSDDALEEALKNLRMSRAKLR